jgi:hypothetical protein
MAGLEGKTNYDNERLVDFMAGRLRSQDELDAMRQPVTPVEQELAAGYVEAAGGEDAIQAEIAERASRETLVKQSNPKDAIGSLKVPYHLLPAPVIAEMALGMLEGACKYGAFNYRVIGVRFSVYYSACRRHLDAFLEGEDIDPDSQLSHITKAITSLVVIRDAMIRGKMHDDRPPGTRGFMAKLNAIAKAIVGRYPDAKPPYLGTDYPADDYNI